MENKTNEQVERARIAKLKKKKKRCNDAIRAARGAHFDHEPVFQSGPIFKYITLLEGYRTVEFLLAFIRFDERSAIESRKVEMVFIVSSRGRRNPSHPLLCLSLFNSFVKTRVRFHSNSLSRFRTTPSQRIQRKRSKSNMRKTVRYACNSRLAQFTGTTCRWTRTW